MEAPSAADASPVAEGPDDDRIAKESARDEPAPAPSADVPPKNGDRP
jgi:NADH-quinone oxidoreductase subunit E